MAPMASIKLCPFLTILSTLLLVLFFLPPLPSLLHFLYLPFAQLPLVQAHSLTFHPDTPFPLVFTHFFHQHT